MSMRPLTCILAIGLTGVAIDARAGLDAPATASLMVQKQGPREGENGRRFLNVQGKDSGEDGKYASYCVLEVKAAKPEAKPAGIKAATLHLTQSIPRFAKDGAFEIYLVAEDVKPLDADSAPDWKFEADKLGGVPDALKKGPRLAKAGFKQVETGHVDAISLDLDDKAKAFLLAQVAEGKAIRLLLTPVDPEVAACYFGVAAEREASRPKLIIEIDK